MYCHVQNSFFLNARAEKMNDILTALCMSVCEREREFIIFFPPSHPRRYRSSPSSGFWSSFGLSSLRVTYNRICARDRSAAFAQNCCNVPKLATPITWTRSAALGMTQVSCCASVRIFRGSPPSPKTRSSVRIPGL